MFVYTAESDMGSGEGGDGNEGGASDVDEYTDDNDPGYVVLDVTDEEFHRLHKVPNSCLHFVRFRIQIES